MCDISGYSMLGKQQVVMIFCIIFCSAVIMCRSLMLTLNLFLEKNTEIVLSLISSFSFDIFHR